MQPESLSPPAQAQAPESGQPESQGDAARPGVTEDITAVLRRLVDEDVPVTLHAAGDPHDQTIYSTALWAEDVTTGLLVLSADPESLAVRALLAAGVAQAAAQLDSAEVRFPLARLALVQGRDTWALQAAYPLEMQRFQRRDAYRVRPLDYSQPTVRLRHPEHRDDGMDLGVVDLSHGGISLRLPEGMAPPPVGDALDGMLELDGLVQVQLLLRVVRVNETARHIGCEITEVAPQDARALQRYIDHTQRRRRMLML